MFFTLNFSHDFSLEPDGPSFIQPEMLPCAVSDKVTRPAVSNLVGVRVVVAVAAVV